MKKNKDRTKILGFLWFFALFASILLLAGVIFSQNNPQEKHFDEDGAFLRNIQSLKITFSETDNWETYLNDWYGFRVKYPKEFGKIKKEKGGAKDKWEYRYSFLRNNLQPEEDFQGFQINIYNLKEIKELSETNEFPGRKREDLNINDNLCSIMESDLSEVNDFEAEEVYISTKNYCYDKTFFFTVVRDEYIYNLVVLAKNEILPKEKRQIIRNFPQFLSFVSSFNLTEIKRPKAPVRPKIVAPMPVSYKVESGRLVCAKKNDKPGKSKQGKSRHLDMECCLDPDEYPNPHCYYDPKKYGKYLK